MDGRTLFFYDKPSASVLPQHLDLNNFHLSPFTHEGRFYLTVEHYYQAHKYPVGSSEFETIRCCATPVQAKGLTRKLEYSQEWWDTVKDEIMRQGLKEKYAQNDEQRDHLMWTWDCFLSEDSPRDAYWGGRIPGSKNRLGALLIEERERLRLCLPLIPTPTLSYLLRPTHPLYPPPTSPHVSPSECLLSIPPSSQEAALQHHPVLSLLPAPSDLLPGVKLVSIPAHQSLPSGSCLFYVLSGSGYCESTHQFPLSPGTWVCLETLPTYITEETDLQVAELDLSMVVAALTTQLPRATLVDSVIFGEMGLIPGFRKAVAELKARKGGVIAAIVASLSASWPNFLTPATVVDSVLYLPVNATAVKEYEVTVVEGGQVKYHQREEGKMMVTLPHNEWEKFVYLVAVFADFRRRIQSESVPGDVVSSLQQHVPESLEEILQTPYTPLYLTLVPPPPPPLYTPVFSQYSISSADILLCDVQQLRLLLSPYFNLITKKARIIANVELAGAQSRLTSLKYDLLVNPEQSYRATEIDKSLGFHHFQIHQQDVIVITPESRALLSLGAEDNHLVCLSYTGGTVTAGMITELKPAVKTVTIVESWQDGVDQTCVKRYQCKGWTVECKAGEGVTAYVPSNSAYITDPLAAKCMESLPGDAVISSLSCELIQILSDFQREIGLRVTALIPDSEPGFISYIASLTSPPHPPDCTFTLLHHGDSSEQLSSLYEFIYKELAQTHNVLEVCTFEEVFHYDVSEQMMGRLKEDVMRFAKKGGEMRVVSWSEDQSRAILRRAGETGRAIVVSAEGIDITEVYPSPGRVILFTLSHPNPAPPAYLCSMSAGVWTTHLSLPLASTLPQVLS